MPSLTRRDLLKASATLSLMALAGCSGGPGTSPTSGPTADTPAGPIARLAIHPAIGFARVGNSPDGWFLGPETPGVPPVADGGFKDAGGFLKRQAARFRLFAFDAEGRVVREVTAADADVAWTVHLANAKAAWYDFDTALDIPGATVARRRNAGVADRASLRIDPGPRTVAGASSLSERFDTGSFLGQQVPLGEIRTDEAGRLLVLGGGGRSFSPLGLQLTTFANNSGWCDDISDGPVTAVVTVDGRTFTADPAWVVVGPPNYGPDIPADFRTLYDVVKETMRTQGRLIPGPVSFTADVMPLFVRLADLQWVNRGIAERYGYGGAEDLADPAFLARLADPSAGNAPFRDSWFQRFRNPDYAEMQPDALPPIYGDAVAVPANDPRNWLAVTPGQYEALRSWAAGDFVSDWNPRDVAALALAELPLALVPAALDRAQLEACLGDAFHPGCEATWPMRIGSMYDGLFRLKHRVGPEPDFGEFLDPRTVQDPGGPLDGCVPGSVSRWMAVPWQSDTASCRSGYEPQVDPYLPTFWAARVPNHVLSEQAYLQAVDPQIPRDQRVQAFRNRSPFFRGIDQSTRTATLQRMVDRWWDLGLVESRPGVADDPDLPPVMKVETGYALGEAPQVRIVDGPMLRQDGER